MAVINPGAEDDNSFKHFVDEHGNNQIIGNLNIQGRELARQNRNFVVDYLSVANFAMGGATEKRLTHLAENNCMISEK